MHRSDIIEYLEGLVHKRFSMETLNKALSEFFKTTVEVDNNTQSRLDSGDYDCEDDLPADFNLMFNIEDGTSKSGFYDIYMLPMRKTGYDGVDMYITEIGYEFI